MTDTKTGVEERFMPTDEQRSTWSRYVMWSDGTADGWWLGWCPKHDESQDPEKATAEYNFMTGRFKCTAAISCHEGRPTIALATVDAWRQGFASLKDMRAKQRERNSSQASTRRAENKAKRQERYAAAGKALESLEKKHADVDRALFPTKPQMAVWEQWIDVRQAPATLNNAEGWWPGWCPLHGDPGKAHSARFNFRYGSYKCLAAEPCHAPKKGMTLVNLARAMEQKKRG